MKKSIHILLALVAAILLLTACGADTDATIPTDIANTTAPMTEEMNHVEQLNSIADDDYSWDNIFNYMMNNVPHEQWPEVLRSFQGCYVNTFNAADNKYYGTKTWRYGDSKFTIVADSWHFVQWSHNIHWDADPGNSDVDRTASVVNPANPAYILCVLGDYYYYLVEITPTAETFITCLEDDFKDDFYVMPADVYMELNKSDTELEAHITTARERYISSGYGIDSVMTYLINEVPRDHWHTILSEMPWSFEDINTFNSMDSNDYGFDDWNFADGKFTIPAGSWHFPEWSYNIDWDTSPDNWDETRTASVANPEEDAYILILLGDYYFYLVEISPNAETAIGSLSEEFVDEFSIIFGF